jgi:hypothetical protein
MEEYINIYEGKGVLHLKGSASDSILYIKKQPVLMTFLGSVGTTWRYFAGKDITFDWLQANYLYDTLVKTGNIDTHTPLSVQFAHITQLLTNGNYKLKLTVLPAEANIWHFSDTEDDGYGGLFDVIATQSHFDQKTIDKYALQIQKGAKPIVILYTTQKSPHIFVIDGHHKLLAYQKVKAMPFVLVMVKLDAKEITEDEGIATLEAFGVSNKNYFAQYTTEKQNGTEAIFYLKSLEKYPDLIF